MTVHLTMRECIELMKECKLCCEDVGEWDESNAGQRTAVTAKDSPSPARTCIPYPYPYPYLAMGDSTVHTVSGVVVVSERQEENHFSLN